MSRIKKLLLLVSGTVFMLSGCTMKSNENSDKRVIADTVIDSVDDGISCCVRTCSNGNESLYIDEFNIYIVDSLGNETAYMADEVKKNEAKITFVGLNTKYVFYYANNMGLYMIDRSNNDQKKILDYVDVCGINSKNENVYVLQSIGRVCEVGSGKEKDVVNDDLDDGVKEDYIYDHYDNYFYIDNDNEKIAIESHESPIFIKDNTWFNGTNVNITPARTAIVDNDWFFMIQTTNDFVAHSNISHDAFKEEALIRYDVQKDESDVLYKTNGNEEQIVNYSFQNDELYLYSEGEIIKADLRGNNKTKICEAPNEKKLYFEYLNNQLLIYDENNKLLGRY